MKFLLNVNIHRKLGPQNLYEQLMTCWPEIEGFFSSGAVIIIEDAALRIRKLPIIDSDEGISL